MPRHTVLVRVTHWVHALGFFALVVSGIAILVAHPRLYWGETGAVGTPSLFDLPIPFMLGHSGWGRYLHFVAAWACVLNGLLYYVSRITVTDTLANLGKGLGSAGAEEGYSWFAGI